MMRELVHGCSGKLIARPQAAQKHGREEKRAIVMNGGITEVRRDGVPSVLCSDAFEVPRHLVKSFVPSDAFPTAGSAANRISETVLVVVNIL